MSRFWTLPKSSVGKNVKVPQRLHGADLFGHVLYDCRGFEIMQPAGADQQQVLADKQIHDLLFFGSKSQPGSDPGANAQSGLAVICSREEFARIMNQRRQAENIKVRALGHEFRETLSVLAGGGMEVFEILNDF
jgi:hypothetical protein